MCTYRRPSLDHRCHTWRGFNYCLSWQTSNPCKHRPCRCVHQHHLAWNQVVHSPNWICIKQDMDLSLFHMNTQRPTHKATHKLTLTIFHPHTHLFLHRAESRNLYTGYTLVLTLVAHSKKVKHCNGPPTTCINDWLHKKSSHSSGYVNRALETNGMNLI
jgi:hypothetical protein